MESIIIGDFSGGWRPEDDPIGGSKNSLLKMDSVELDQNGSLTMPGGTRNIFPAFSYPANAHTVFSKFILGAQRRYLSLVDGSIYRDTTSILSGGSSTRAAFGVAYNFILICSGSLYKKDTGFGTPTNLGVTTPSNPPTVIGYAPDGPLIGTVEYAQVHVAKFNDAYVAKSPLGPISEPQELNFPAKVTVRLQSFTTDDTQATETWLFRRGGQLDDWYRVKIATNTASDVIDELSDEDALSLNIKTNEYIVNISSIGKPILAIAGLINGRTIYFTADSLYISEIGSPDSFDSRYVTGLAGTATEVFLWAIKVDDNAVLIGTTVDLYLLSGTFKTIGDGTIDFYFDTLNVDTPPIAIDVAKYQNSVVYMAADGWKLFSPQGGSIPLCATVTDRVYRGESLHGYGGVPIYPYPTTDTAGIIPRYSCVVARNKLWVRVPTLQGNNSLPFLSRMEVYDFTRKYWRTLALSPLLLTEQEDDAIAGFFETGHKLLEIDYQFSKLNDEGASQNVIVRFPFHDNGKIKNRKDGLTFRARGYFPSPGITLNIYKDGNYNDIVYSDALVNTSYGEIFINLIDTASLQGFKNLGIELIGVPTDFRLTDITIDYEPRPEPTMSLKFLAKIPGPNKKRLRTMPFLIDTRGVNVTVTPTLDGVIGVPQIINTASKMTAFYFFLTDVYAMDYDFNLSGSDETLPFELWNLLQPEIVQTLPTAKRFDQIGPTEMFRWGKLKNIEVRLIAFGSIVAGNIMPYTIYFEDAEAFESSFAIYDSKEAIYTIAMPKTTHGKILRIELGPTTYDFHRIYTRILVSKSGVDTDLKWITLEEGQLQ